MKDKVRRYIEEAVNERLREAYPSLNVESDIGVCERVRRASVDTCMKQRGRGGVQKETLFRALELMSEGSE